MRCSVCKWITSADQCVNIDGHIACKKCHTMVEETINGLLGVFEEARQEMGDEAFEAAMEQRLKER